MSDTPSLHNELTLLKSAVGEAAELVMGYFQRDPKSWKKNDVSPVSEADLASDALLKDKLLGARPDYGWLSEETEDSDERLSQENIWIVDPIDGTNAFLNGKSDFTICAGLVRSGQAVVGVVINPVNEQVFSAVRGQGAWLNDEPLSGPIDTALDDAHLLCRRNVMKQERWTGAPPNAQNGYIGSLAYQLCLLANGEWNAAVSANPLHEWDIAAAGLILAEAGGKVTDQCGNPLRYNQPTPKIDGMICAGPGLHAAISDKFIPK